MMSSFNQVNHGSDSYPVSPRRVIWYNKYRVSNRKNAVLDHHAKYRDRTNSH
jgi:hypothetical protein